MPSPWEIVGRSFLLGNFFRILSMKFDRRTNDYKDKTLLVSVIGSTFLGARSILAQPPICMTALLVLLAIERQGYQPQPVSLLNCGLIILIREHSSLLLRQRPKAQRRAHAGPVCQATTQHARHHPYARTGQPDYLKSCQRFELCRQDETL